MLSINTMWIMRGLMSVTEVADLVCSVPRALLSHCMHLKMESFLTVSPSCSRTYIRPALKGELDSLVRHLMFFPHQRFASSCSNPCMLRLLWKDGITSMTDISAKVKVGIMFTIVFLSLREAGIKYFTQVLGSPQGANEMR
jgi:hypothetical protein